MSDGGEKTCPLCAEEMDLTDQQLKPCRCGYEVCVWCWHHIMEIAEKGETEGRCPACRTPYNKEKIVGTAENCGRLVAEVSMEKKYKSQKAKSKASENRKQLTTVRVIQRNLVYIVGLPLDLADEDLLQRNDYFGQYGMVLKISISRTSAGTIQQFANSTCSVYITYARDDEAVRCIQSVHMFVLEGRPLRACFGTTKYCHAWLRNIPCNNHDCLYLHEIGSQEVSFIKDEIVSAYSRVQQITGITNNMQGGSGNVLPPPADDYSNNSSTVRGDPEVKSSLNSSASSSRVSLPSSSAGRPGGLPAAASWGARASSCNPTAGSVASSDGPTKKKAETSHGLLVVASALSGSPHVSTLHNNTGKSHLSNEEAHTRHIKSKQEDADATAVKQHTDLDSKASVSEASAAVPVVKSASQTRCSLASDCSDREASVPPNPRYSIDERPCSPNEREGGSSVVDVKIQKHCVKLSLTGPADGLTLDTFISHRDHGLQWHDHDRSGEQSSGDGKSAVEVISLAGASEMCNITSDVQTSEKQHLTSETEDEFDNHRLRDAIVSKAPMPVSSTLHTFDHLRIPSQTQHDSDFAGNYIVNPPILYKGSNEEESGLNLPKGPVLSNEFLEHLVNRACSQGSSLTNGILGNYLGQHDGEVAHIGSQPALDMGENHIISNILSLELDSWDDSLTSPNFGMLFGENDKQEGTLISANPWKSQISNQSRFSFVRQEDSRIHLFEIEPTLANNSHYANNPSFSQGFVGSRERCHHALGNGIGFHHVNMEVSNSFLGGHPALPSSKLPVSRSQILAPPGFNTRSRPPPPGFTSHERSDQSLDFLNSGNQLHETSSFLRNPYQAFNSRNISTANDIEFIDPAILAVGKGMLPNSSAIDMRQNFHVQAPGFENELRHQSLVQRSSPHQILRYNDVRDNFSPSNDVYVYTSRHIEQGQANNAPPFSHFSLEQPRNTIVSNGQWDGWSELQSPNNVGMADLLRNDRTGLSKFYGGYEDSKFQMTDSGDIYNKSFGM